MQITQAKHDSAATISPGATHEAPSTFHF